MTSHYALGLSNLDWIGIVIICCSFIFIYVFEKHLLNINTEVKAIRELQEKRRYETSIIPAQPGYFIVRGVWESDTKIGSLEYEPIIAWRMLYASGTYDDSVHVYPINERWSLSHKDDLAIRRPSGSIYLPYNTFSFGSDTFDTEPRYMAHLERAKAKNDLDW